MRALACHDIITSDALAVSNAVGIPRPWPWLLADADAGRPSVQPLSQLHTAHCADPNTALVATPTTRATTPAG